MLKIAYSEVYKYDLPEGHRFPMIKYELLPEQLLYEGTIRDENFFHPDQLKRSEILLTHHKEYLDKLESQNLSKKEERKIGFPVNEKLVDRGKYIACGTFQCSLFAIKNGISMNIAGGTHHAYPDHGGGFCVFNDISIASKLLLEKALVSKILIVDLDVHQGDANAFIFKDDARVFTFSMHGENNYPLRKQVSDLDIGLPDRTDDLNYLKTLYKQLPILIDRVKPDIIFYQAGVDILETDKLGRLSISSEGCKKRDQFVFREAKMHGIPVVVTMGGGYSHKLSDIVNAHANTFREAQNIYF